jgi:hypothetical protein
MTHYKRTGLIVLIVSLSLAVPVFAQIYEWVDENGVKRFSNEPPPESAVNVKATEELEYDKAADEARGRKEDAHFQEVGERQRREQAESEKQRQAQERQKALEKEKAEEQQIRAQQEEIQRTKRSKRRIVSPQPPVATPLPSAAPSGPQ